MKKSLLGRLQQAGTLHARGEFTLDLEKAGSKLSRFQFPDEADFLFQLIAGLRRLGARSVEVEHRDQRLRLKLSPGLSLPPDCPARLNEALLEELSPQRRLAAACHALLSHSPQRFLWLGKGGTQSYDYLSDSSQNWKHPQLQELDIDGLPGNLLARAVSRLVRAARFSRLPLSVNGRACVPETPGPVPLGEGGGCCLSPDLSVGQGRLTLLIDDLETDIKLFECPLPWNGVVHWPREARLDASFSGLLEDQSYLDFLQRTVPQTFAACLAEACRRREESSQRSMLMRIRLAPACSEWWPALDGQPLFCDFAGTTASLEQLQGGAPAPVYFSPTRIPAEVQDRVLEEKDQAALELLRAQLGERLVLADALVIRQLRRERNQRAWREQPLENMDLPQQQWMLEEMLETPQGLCRLAIPNDWTEPAGQVIFRHQGRFLVRRELIYQDIPCTVVCEVAESGIAELWDDVTENCWQDLGPRWVYRIDQMLKKLSESGSQLGTMREHLLRHLAGARNPERSYFASVPLFRDYQGELLSLRDLQQAALGGKPPGFSRDELDLSGLPVELLPKATWLVESDFTLDCLRRVSGLTLCNHTDLLRDLKALPRVTPPEKMPGSPPWTVSVQGSAWTGWVRILPAVADSSGRNHGEVAVHSFGYSLGQQKISAAAAFEGEIYCDSLSYSIRSEEGREKEQRWLLRTNHGSWLEVELALVAAVQRSLELRLDEPFVEREWLDWARQAVFQGLGVGRPHLLEARCLDGKSLQSYLEREPIYWSSRHLDRGERRKFREAHSEAEIWDSLDPAGCQRLRRFYGGVWECADDWFAHQERLVKFMRKSTESLTISPAWSIRSLPAPLQGSVAFVDPRVPRGDADPSRSGEIRWYYLQRLVHVERTGLPAGLCARVQAPDLQLSDSLQELLPSERVQEVRELVREQMAEVLADWLDEPRPEHADLIKFWPGWLGLSPRLPEGLQRQPWFSTSVGRRSFQELLEQPELYQLERASYDIPPQALFVFRDVAPAPVLQSLFSQIGKVHSVLESQRFLERHVQGRQRRELLRVHSERLQRLPYKVDLKDPFEGEVALTASRAGGDLWLILEDRVVPLRDLPIGWSGWLHTKDYRLRRQGGEEGAELSVALRKRLFAQLLPALLTRIEAGRLGPRDRRAVTAFALSGLHYTSPNRVESPWTTLVEARWLPCADGSLTSLQQLRLEAQERGQLDYWSRTYWLKGESPAGLTPILADPALLELVQRWCATPLQLLPPPLLYRDVRELTPAPRLGGMRKVLEGMGRWIVERGARPVGKVWESLFQLSEQVDRSKDRLRALKARKPDLSRNAPEDELERLGRPLLRALRRQTSQLLSETARRETLTMLEGASWESGGSSRSLWTLKAGRSVVLHARHPALKPWLEAERAGEEPPHAVVLSLLLALICEINALSPTFTDAMERDFLNQLGRELVGSNRELLSPPKKSGGA